MLFMDGASSHTNEEFVRVCYSKNVLPVQLSAHTLFNIFYQIILTFNMHVA